MRKKDRGPVLEEVGRRVLEKALNSQPGADLQSGLDHLLHEVLYYEQKRLESDSLCVARADDEKWLKTVRSRFGKGGLKEKKQLLEEIIVRHTEEVGGNFSPPVYGFSTRVVPQLLGFLLNASSPLGIIKSHGKPPDVAARLEISGPIEQIRKLADIGTSVFVPTHSSNMDSIIMGYAIYRCGLPPLTYGAGLNLFHHRFLGFFMNRLGAYKVDRLKKHRLYNWVLKEYASVTMEKGYPNLFFPGGTRSRSGAVEQNLKLGLLGCCIHAYKNNVRENLSESRRNGSAGTGKQPKPVFIVPCTLNYQLVLEAQTLIEDHLKSAGKSRFIISDDEFSRVDRIASFMKSLFTLDAKIYVRFGRVMDPFGNPVDESGRSMDGRGRLIDPSRYFMQQGRFVEDEQRDWVYTRLLGKSIARSFAKETVVFSTNVLAWAVFDELRRRQPDPDFYRFLRETAYDVSLPMVEVYEHAERVLSNVRDLAGRGFFHLAEPLRRRPTEEVVDSALRLFGCYHEKPVVRRKGDRLLAGDMNLLYYYRNRLWGLGLE